MTNAPVLRETCRVATGTQCKSARSGQWLRPVLLALIAAGLASAQTVPSRSNLPPLTPLPQLIGIGHSFDAAKDFSINENPTGPWSYGCFVSAKKPQLIFSSTAKRNLPGQKKLECWLTKFGDTPSVAHNKSTETLKYLNITHPPDCLNLHPGPAGQLSVVRFTVPIRSWYIVKGRFQALDADATTDPHILVNGKEAVPVQPIQPGTRRDFAFTQELAKGDTIDFAVGDGGNGYSADSTGLAITIIPSLQKPLNTATLVAPAPGPAPPPEKTPAAPATIPPALTGLKQRYQNPLQALRIETETRLKHLKTDYLLALDEFKRGAMSRGDLDQVLAAKAETERINAGQEPTAGQKKALPAALAPRHSQYETDLTHAVMDSQKKQLELQTQYIRELELLQKQLTQRGDIDGAIAVKQEREQATASLPK